MQNLNHVSHLNLTDPLQPTNPPIHPVIPPLTPVNPIPTPVNPTPTPIRPSKPIGGGTDAHGCRTPAGYSWCPRENRCVRVWEVAKERGITPQQAGRYCNSRPHPPHPPPPRPWPPMPMPTVDVVGSYTDARGCRPSAGYTWCPRENRCVRIWELADDRGTSPSEASAYCNSSGGRSQPPSRHSETTRSAAARTYEKTTDDDKKSFMDKHGMVVYIAIGVIVALLLVIVLLILFRGKKGSRFSRRR